MDQKCKVSLLQNNKAKKKVISISNHITDKNSNYFNCIDKKIINEWVSETRSVRCYTIKFINSVHINSFVILSKMDFDPLKLHKNPYMLNYIHTFEKYRRSGYAYKLLKFIMKCDIDISTFCSNEKSKLLFEKAGFKLNDYIHRYSSPMN